MEHADDALPGAASGSDGFVRVRGRASTTSRTSTSASRAMPSSSSRASPARASRRSPSARSTPRHSGATWSRSRPTRDGCSTRSACRRSTRSTACRRPWRFQQQRGSPSARSSVGSVTTLSNLLRMLYSRAGEYPPGQGILYAESFSPNTPEGACPECHGLGRVYEVTERSMVPDDSLTIRQRAVAAWPTAWQGQNLREILMTLGVDVDTPWRDLPKKDRDWILFTDEQPTVPVYSGYTADEVKKALKRKEEPSYMGTFTGARRHVLNSFANSQSALMRKRAPAIHDRGRLPHVPRQATPPRGAGCDVRRAGHRRPLGPADGAARRHPEALCRGGGGRPGEAQQGAPGEGAGREADRLRPRREAGRAARPRPRLPGAGPRHAHALARRVAAAPAGDAGPLQPVRRRLRAGRALGGPPPVRHRGAAAGARPTEGVRQLPLRRRARPRRDRPRRLDRRRRPRGRPARRRDPLQRPPGRPRRGRGVADPALSLPGARRPRADAPRAPGAGSAWRG